MVVKSQGVGIQSSQGSVQSSSSHSDGHLEVQSSASQQEEAGEEQSEMILALRTGLKARVGRGDEDGEGISWVG